VVKTTSRAPKVDRCGGRVTLADIAARTGLNISTISRALTKPDRVNAQTRKLVLKAAEQLGYTTNLAARSLSRGRSEMIMAIMPSFPGRPISPVLIEALRGVCDEARARNYGVIVKPVDQADVPAEELMDLALNGMVDGVLLFSALRNKVTPTRLRVPSGTHVISVFHDLLAIGLSSVVAREQAGFYEMTDYLIRQGHRRFAYLGGPPGLAHELFRFAGVQQRLAEEGSHATCHKLKGGAFDMETGLKAADQFLALRDRPSAVLCCCDGLALGFMRGVLKAGLKVPGDVAITGYDGLEEGKYATPALTTVSQPSVEIGRVATRMLIERCESQAPATPQLVALNTTLVERESA
jgi:LacI family transcriptional regulator, repressor for deo operon, udp, cdd, tsx, nupC, and nupG